MPITCLWHPTTCGPVGTAALHVAASTTNFKIQEHFNDFADAWVKESVTGMVEVDPADGCFPLPNGPGLGVTLNEAFVAEHPPKDAFFDLFAENWHQRRGASRGDRCKAQRRRWTMNSPMAQTESTGIHLPDLRGGQLW